MCDRVVARLADPDADAAWKDPAAAADDAVVHGDPAGLVGGFRGDPSLTDPDAACTKIDQGEALDATVGAAMPEPDPVNPGVLDPAIRQGQVPGIVCHDHRGDARRRLAVAVPLGRKQVAAVAKGQPLEGQVLDNGAGT